MDEGPEDKDGSTEYNWSVRVFWTRSQQAKVYAGKNAFSVGGQASFTQETTYPSAVEYLLGALGGDLVTGYHAQAAKRGVTVDATELVASGRLDNPMVFLGVVGAEGHPGFGSISATLYVSSDADEPTLQEVWRATLITSPLVNTLERSVKLSLQMQLLR